jgi:hypothetical protein
VPFDFLRRKKDQSSEAASQVRDGDAKAGGKLVPFDGLTEEWRLRGRMQISGRLSDALNKREALAISDVSWAPIDGSAGFTAVPGLKSIDPYDLIIVLAGEATQAPLSEAERVAHKVHKIAYDVALEAPPFRIIGTVYLYPGSEPDRLLDRATEMFVPVVDALAYLGEQQLSDPEIEAILVNRFYLRGVEQVDKRTGERHQKLPGAPLGGVSWQERSR